MSLEPFPEEDEIRCNDCGHLADEHGEEEPFLCTHEGDSGAGCDCEGLDLGSIIEDDEGAGDE